MPLDQARFRHQFQMPTDARLTLAEDAGEVLDVEFARLQQHKDAQSRRLRRRLENCHD